MTADTARHKSACILCYNICDKALRLDQPGSRKRPYSGWPGRSCGGLSNRAHRAAD